MTSQRIHFISIGGSSMHNLAIALKQQGNEVTGSDDAIYDPSRARLQQFDLLPTEIGWFPERIHTELDAVIVCMHAGKMNPELQKAQELAIPVFSYPEFIYQQSQQKQRVVIAGSHGKTTITAIILHVLKFYNREFDYWIGETVDGFDSTVRLSTQDNGREAPIIIVEADEYASSPVDSRPKFLNYQPHIALINGIAWDHVNAYPTWDSYVETFESLAEAMPKAGILLFDESDDMLDVIGQKDRADITKIPYLPHHSLLVEGKVYLLTKQREHIPIELFGEHNMKNIAGAMALCDRIGISDEQFYKAISSFKGVSARLQKIIDSQTMIVYRDFAQSPATIEASIRAIKSRYPNKVLCAVLEINPIILTNAAFSSEYQGKLQLADTVIIYSDELTSNHRPSLSRMFDEKVPKVFTNSIELKRYLINEQKGLILLMSSKDFGGMNLA